MSEYSAILTSIEKPYPFCVVVKFWRCPEFIERTAVHVFFLARLVRYFVSRAAMKDDKADHTGLDHEEALEVSSSPLS
jgi:hypothetical protein